MPIRTNLPVITRISAVDDPTEAGFVLTQMTQSTENMTWLDELASFARPLLCADYARSHKPSQVAGSLAVAADMALRTHRETSEKAYVAQVGNVYCVFPTQSSVQRAGGRILGVADDDAYHSSSALPRLQSNPKRAK